MRWAGRSQIKFFPTIGKRIRVSVAAACRERERRVCGNPIIGSSINRRRSISCVCRDATETAGTKSCVIGDLIDARSMKVRVGGAQILEITKGEITPIRQDAASVSHNRRPAARFIRDDRKATWPAVVNRAIEGMQRSE